MKAEKELEIINSVLDYRVKEISPDTRFWMVRTKKGYFYNEFITRKYVALAWNYITCQTIFSDQTKESLCDSIMLNNPEIKRPTTVYNKCKTFIEDVKENDIILIPSAGTSYITFAIVGEYFEDESKTVELEKAVIERIEHGNVEINEVSCPYRKRRKISPLKTVKNENLNYGLYRALSNYHGISNLDSYSRNILGMIYNVYSHNNNLNIVFNVMSQNPVSPRYVSGILHGATEFLSLLKVEDHKISTQININSPGPIDFFIKEGFNFIKNNYLPLLAILTVISGGSFLTFKLPGVPQMFKDIVTIPHELRLKKLEEKKIKSEGEMLELNVLEKKIELYKIIKSCGVNSDELINAVEILSKNSSALDVQPLENTGVPIIPEASLENELEDE